jgi:hypothetical protein
MGCTGCGRADPLRRLREHHAAVGDGMATADRTRVLGIAPSARSGRRRSHFSPTIRRGPDAPRIGFGHCAAVGPSHRTREVRLEPRRERDPVASRTGVAARPSVSGRSRRRRGSRRRSPLVPGATSARGDRCCTGSRHRCPVARPGFGRTNRDHGRGESGLHLRRPRHT